MKLILATIACTGLFYLSDTESKVYKDNCNGELIISEKEFFFDDGKWWSKGRVNWKEGQLILTGVTIYDTIVKHILPDGTDSLYNEADFKPIESLDSISNRTHSRDISLVACCGGQLDSFNWSLDIVSDSVMILTNGYNKQCDTLKLKSN